ncbi:hypothetical protein [Viscerimonas tarda]
MKIRRIFLRFLKLIGLIRDDGDSAIKRYLKASSSKAKVKAKVSVYYKPNYNPTVKLMNSLAKGL